MRKNETIEARIKVKQFELDMIEYMQSIIEDLERKQDYNLITEYDENNEPKIDEMTGEVIKREPTMADKYYYPEYMAYKTVIELINDKIDKIL